MNGDLPSSRKVYIHSLEYQFSRHLLLYIFYLKCINYASYPALYYCRKKSGASIFNR